MKEILINNAYIVGTDIESGFSKEKYLGGTWKLEKVKYRKAKPYKPVLL